MFNNNQPPIVQATYDTRPTPVPYQQSAAMPTPVPYQSNAAAPTPLPYQANAAVMSNTTEVPTGNLNSGDSFRKEKQQKRTCKDWPFALLFIVNIIVVAVLTVKYGVDAFNEELQKQQDRNTNYKGFLKGAVTTGAFGLVFSGLMLLVLIRIPKFMIKASLIGSVVASGIWALAALSMKMWGAGVIGIIFFAISICYAFAVWSRIPFATANLTTACKAVNSNCGITVVAYFMVSLAFGWSLLWTVAFGGVWDKTYTCSTKTDRDGTTRNSCTGNLGYVFLLLVSYFFTHQVLKNALHATVAGVVGTWWFVPEDGKSCCSPAVIGSWYRSMTSSLGSICFGSLLVAIIQALRTMANAARSQDDGNGMLLCLAECILSCLESIIEYFNKWAFVYVGLYGYSYIEAGKNVMQLFKDRGWEAIIADDLIRNTLGLSTLVVGGLSGCFGLILNNNVDWFEENGSKNATIAFFIGFIVGLVLCSILLSVIESAVNAVIVCFADGPREFEEHHPELSRKMRTAWAEIYPDVGI